MKNLLRLITVLLLAALLTRGGFAAPGQKPVRLHLWAAWGIPDPENPDADVMNTAVMQEFQKRHPEIAIEVTSGLKIQGPGAESGLLMALAGGTGPDVIYVNMRQMNTYLRQGFLYPLDEYLEKDPKAMSRLSPALRKALAASGHFYAIPWFQDNMALYYRKDLFRAADLDPDRPPKDWNEFYSYAQKLTIPEKGDIHTWLPVAPAGIRSHLLLPDRPRLAAPDYRLGNKGELTAIWWFECLPTILAFFLGNDARAIRSG